MTGFPKPRPQRLGKQDRSKARAQLDRDENTLVKMRSQGQCEVYENHDIRGHKFSSHTLLLRCRRRAVQIHHMLGGWGLRARGRSASANHKQHVCVKCHQDITGHVLKLRSDGPLPLWSDGYERIS